MSSKSCFELEFLSLRTKQKQNVYVYINKISQLMTSSVNFQIVLNNIFLLKLRSFFLPDMVLAGDEFLKDKISNMY